MRALVDSVRNGAVERLRPAVSWGGAAVTGAAMWMATRRLLRAPALVLAVTGTLGVGLGLFGVVYTVIHKVLVEPLPYKDPDDLYFVWRDYRDLRRGWLAGTDVDHGYLLTFEGNGSILSPRSTRGALCQRLIYCKAPWTF